MLIKLKGMLSRLGVGGHVVPISTESRWAPWICSLSPPFRSFHVQLSSSWHHVPDYGGRHFNLSDAKPFTREPSSGNRR